jgi:arylsulfatase A-like enzyme
MVRIVYFDIDSCRPDHLGCYGYNRPTSPTIDALAAGGTRFTNCFASDTPCLPSRAALFSARLGINNGVTCHNGPASQLRYGGNAHYHDPERAMWMRVFQRAGWETVGFAGFGQRHLAWWFSAGFTQYFGNQLPGGSEPAWDVSNKALAWLDRDGQTDNWFMHLNFWDVHSPYRATESARAAIRDTPVTSGPNESEILEDAEQFYGPRTPEFWWIQSPDFSNADHAYVPSMPEGNPTDWETYTEFVDGYDGGVVQVDREIARVIDRLESLGVRDDTIIIVSADHGESIGELGLYFEHGNCAEGTTKVPLIINWPGVVPAGMVVDDLMYQLDLPPTILDLLGMPIPGGWDGRSMRPAMTGSDAGVRDHLVLGTGIFSFQRAVRTDRYRLIRTIHSGLYPYEPLYLFDLEADPLQRHNIAAEQPDIVAKLDHYLMDWLWTYTTGPGAVMDPFQLQLAAGIDPDLYCSRANVERRLETLGRTDQLADLHRRRNISRPVTTWESMQL